MFNQTRTLIAAADGVYLWPGVALARGGRANIHGEDGALLARLYGPRQRWKMRRGWRHGAMLRRRKGCLTRRACRRYRQTERG